MPFQAKRGIAGRHQNCSGYLSTVPNDSAPINISKELLRINLYILLVWFSDLIVRKPRRTKKQSGTRTLTVFIQISRADKSETTLTAHSEGLRATLRAWGPEQSGKAQDTIRLSSELLSCAGRPPS